MVPKKRYFFKMESQLRIPWAPAKQRDGLWDVSLSLSQAF